MLLMSIIGLTYCLLALGDHKTLAFQSELATISMNYDTVKGDRVRDKYESEVYHMTIALKDFLNNLEKCY